MYNQPTKTVDGEGLNTAMATVIKHLEDCDHLQIMSMFSQFKENVKQILSVRQKIFNETIAVSSEANAVIEKFIKEV